MMTMTSSKDNDFKDSRLSSPRINVRAVFSQSAQAPRLRIHSQAVTRKSAQADSGICFSRFACASLTIHRQAYRQARHARE